FEAVYEEGSYSAAARRMGQSVPTTWEQIKCVEKAYQTRLFDRQGRQIVAMAAADELIKSIKPVLAGMRSSFEMLHEHDETIPQKITLATGVRMMLDELAPKLRQFQREFTDVQLRLMNADNRTSQQYILDGTADIALMLEPTPDMTHLAISYQPAYSIDYLAVMPKTHRLAKKKSIELSDLVDSPIVVGHQGTVGRRLLEQSLHSRGLLHKLRVSAETDNSAVTIACVKAGLGIGVLAGAANGPQLRPLASRSLRKHLGQARIVSLTQKGRQSTGAMRRLLELIHDIEVA
ncbi:MAG TPA: LysR family transcriptional regulator, partial [Pirellulaceae bacterium]|nr:LysR family transcriptional regulator [Pirellulaceae bacterium]